MLQPTTKLADDLIVGADKVSKYTGLPVRTVYELAKTGALPLFKIGRRIAARKSVLDRLGQSSDVAA